jgi:hypothetical protein
MLCWPFGNRRRSAPPAPQRAAGRWEYVPHIKDGYWVEYTPEQMAKQTGLRAWKQYPFSRYVWEWKGYKLGDDTIMRERFPNEKQDKPKSPYWVPAYDQFAPGQKYNL